MTTMLIEQEVRPEISGIIATAEAFRIVNSDTLLWADQEFNRLREKKKIILSKLDPIRDGLEQEKKKVIALIKELTGPCDQGASIYERKILTFKAEIRKKEEEERARLQAIADEEARKAREAEAEALLKLAATVEKGGDAEQAEALMEEAVKIESAPIKAAPVEMTPTMPGLASVEKQTYCAEVVDLEALIKAVMAGTVPRAALKIEANMTYLNGRAKAEEDSLSIAGVVAKPKATLAKGRSMPAIDVPSASNGAGNRAAVAPLF